MSELAMAIAAPPSAAASLDALYRDAAHDVYAYVATMVGDRATAEDVTMAAFERALRRRRSFDRRRGSERAWLFGIARNAALDELRRRRRMAPLTTELAEAPAPDDDDVDRRAAVRDAIAALDPRDRELVALRFHAGLSHAEIARLLGISEANAGTRLHRVLTRLREACHAP